MGEGVLNRERMMNTERGESSPTVTARQVYGCALSVVRGVKAWHQYAEERSRSRLTGGVS